MNDSTRLLRDLVALPSVNPMGRDLPADIVLEHRTAIVIAHRLSTIRYADRIIVLRRGGIAEEGNHETLVERGGHYAHLYNTYFRHQSPDYNPGDGFVPVRVEVAG